MLIVKTAAVALLAVSLPVAAQIVYFSQTADGKVAITNDSGGWTPDRPASNRMPITHPAAAAKSPPIGGPQKAPRKTDPSQRGDVVLFATEWCGYCRKARAYLAQHRIPYTEYNVETEEGQNALEMMGGGQGVPILMVGERRIRGFSAGLYDSAFQPTK